MSSSPSLSSNPPQIRTTQVDIPPDMIDLGIGQPGFDLLPLEIIRQASAHRLGQGDPDMLNYGNEQGDGLFRLELAAFLSQGYGHPVSMDNLFVTSGASQALDLICTLFTRPGDTIFVEEPSYFLALRIFADHHLNVLSIPIDEQGMDVDILADALAEMPTADRPRFVYTIPTFQNPTGVTLPQARRDQLVALSVKYDFLIVADEVYHLLNYGSLNSGSDADGNALPMPLAAYEDSDTVLSVGSFSKILAPGLRLGWIQGTTDLVRRFVTCGMVDSGGGLNPLTSSIVRSVLELGLQAEYLAALKATYGRRVAVLDQVIQTKLGDQVAYARPGGGFFFWVRLADGMDAETLLPLARQHNVAFQPGVRFSSRGALRDCLRLSFAFYAEDELEEGIARLAQALALSTR